MCAHRTIYAIDSARGGDSFSFTLTATTTASAKYCVWLKFNVTFSGTFSVRCSLIGTNCAVYFACEHDRMCIVHACILNMLSSCESWQQKTDDWLLTDKPTAVVLTTTRPLSSSLTHLLDLCFLFCPHIYLHTHDFDCHRVFGILLLLNRWPCSRFGLTFSADEMAEVAEGIFFHIIHIRGKDQ